MKARITKLYRRMELKDDRIEELEAQIKEMKLNSEILAKLRNFESEQEESTQNDPSGSSDLSDSESKSIASPVDENGASSHSEVPVNPAHQPEAIPDLFPAPISGSIPIDFMNHTPHAANPIHSAPCFPGPNRNLMPVHSNGGGFGHPVISPKDPHEYLNPQNDMFSTMNSMNPFSMVAPPQSLQLPAPK